MKRLIRSHYAHGKYVLEKSKTHKLVVKTGASAMKIQRASFLLFALAFAGILGAGAMVPTGAAAATGAYRDTERAAPDDKAISESVLAELQTHGNLEFQPISVKTVEGKVILNGTVQTNGERDAAEQYSRRIPGVKKVLNGLEAIEPTSE